MIIKEFKSPIQGANSYTVRVVDHKTDYNGPANIVFNANLYSHTEKYLHYFCNALAGASTDELATYQITSWMGGKMDSSLICMEVTSFWNQYISGNCLKRGGGGAWIVFNLRRSLAKKTGWVRGAGGCFWKRVDDTPKHTMEHTLEKIKSISRYVEWKWEIDQLSVN